MTEAQTALSRRLVTSPRWRWMPGMKVDEGFRVTESYERFMFPVDRPDLTDPATLGCVLALVRAAWGDPGMFARPRGGKVRPDWAVFAGETSDIICAAPTEAEALVAALCAVSDATG